MTTINSAAKAIRGTRSIKGGDKRGPKAGSSRASQSAQYAKGELTKAARKPAPVKTSDVISSVKGTTSGADALCVMAPGQTTLVIKRDDLTAIINKAAVVGGSYAAVAKLIAERRAGAGLAKGLDAHNAPQSAKAVADNRRAAKASAPAAPAKPAKAAPAPKKATPAKASTPTGPDRKYKATKKADESKAGSFRTYMISTIRAHGTTSAAKAAHTASGQFAKERLNFKWAHDHGYIVLSDLA